MNHALQLELRREAILVAHHAVSPHALDAATLRRHLAKAAHKPTDDELARDIDFLTKDGLLAPEESPTSAALRRTTLTANGHRAVERLGY